MAKRQRDHSKHSLISLFNTSFRLDDILPVNNPKCLTLVKQNPNER